MALCKNLLPNPAIRNISPSLPRMQKCISIFETLADSEVLARWKFANDDRELLHAGSKPRAHRKDGFLAHTYSPNRSPALCSLAEVPRIYRLYISERWN